VLQKGRHSCSTSDTCRVTLVISHEREKDLQVLTNQLLLCGGRRGRDHMVVGFTITCVLSAYHHLCFLNLNPAHEDTTICDKFGLCHK
jgi:hypothetical protein